MLRKSAYMLIVALCLCWSAVSNGAETETDSTVASLPQEPGTSVGEAILVVPETILKSPIYAIKGLTWVAVNGIYRNATLHKLAGYAFAFRPAGGIVPVVSFGSNAGWRYGLSYTRLGILQASDRARWVASHSTNKYRRLEMTYFSPEAFSSSVGLQFAAGYRKRPRESFYGLGNDTKDTERSAFTMERSQIRASVPWQALTNVKVSAEAGFTAYRVFDGLSPDWPTSLSELREMYGMTHADFRSADIIETGLTLDHDWRDSQGQPSRGGREILSLQYCRGVGRSDDIDFVVSRAEISHYLNIYNKRLLAIKIAAQSVDADDKKTPVLPFYLKSNLGGRDDLRGFLNNRLVDNDMTMAVIEYRWPIWSMIDAFVFAEAGRVYSSISEEFTLKNWHEGYGTGLRVWRENSVILSLQVAFSDEERRIYLELGGEW
ncbi:MAG: BamA/TamA family outer membrane protein [bacterium]|nr:BamA/TamA family outer membrane protein [bacterium]